MARGKDVPTRAEVTEKIETNKREMEAKEVDIGKIVEDLETVKHTLEQLDFGGTVEGSDEVRGSIEGAENVTEEAYGREDEGLEQVQTRNEEFEGELQERGRSSESDLGKISDAKVETKETIKQLEDAREAALREIDFLKEQLLRASEARRESNAIQEKLQARVHAGKRG